MTGEKLSRLKAEIRRAYEVQGDQAECQNYRDIIKWYQDYMITTKQYESLQRYNRKLAEAKAT